MKLNVLLGKTDAQAPVFKGALKDYANFFQKSQGAFKGEKKTYDVNPDKVDDPALRGITKAQTTVDEKLEYLERTQSEYLDNLFNQEATNASGTAKVELKLDDISFGILSSLELLRLKNVLEMQEVTLMYSNIPVRSDSKIWEKTDEPEYEGRNIYETPMHQGINKTTDKENYILPDPNIGLLKDPSAYKPQLAIKTTTVELGTWTRQEFSGEYSQVQKAAILERISKLKIAVIAALKECNEIEIVKSSLTGKQLFDYLHRGK